MLRHSLSAKDNHVIITGDFNCPDIVWKMMTVLSGTADDKIQQALIDLSVEHRLTHVHDQPTTENNMLNLMFTNNPTLIKSSTSIHGISDHFMVATYIYVLPQKPRHYI